MAISYFCTNATRRATEFRPLSCRLQFWRLSWITYQLRDHSWVLPFLSLHLLLCAIGMIIAALFQSGYKDLVRPCTEMGLTKVISDLPVAKFNGYFFAPISLGLLSTFPPTWFLGWPPLLVWLLPLWILCGLLFYANSKCWPTSGFGSISFHLL